MCMLPYENKCLQLISSQIPQRHENKTFQNKVEHGSDEVSNTHYDVTRSSSCMMASQSNGNSIVCQAASSCQENHNIKILHYWPFVEGSHQRSVTRKAFSMGLLPDTQNWGLRMRRECRERFPRHRLQRKPLVSDPGMHHGTCVTHVPWCMSGSLTSGGGENVPGIPSACATRNFAYLVRGPCHGVMVIRCNTGFLIWDTKHIACNVKLV